jgi:tetrahydromethanopterin S-methyltransferase subunit A
MNIVENIVGEICKIVLPINEEIFLGNQKSSIAICTLSSMKLLNEISNSSLMSEIALVGRLLSENKGIDSLIRYVISRKNIKTILICGKDTTGHRSGHSLLKLYENGIDYNGKIIDSFSPDPVLTITKSEIQIFQKQIIIINEIGKTDILEIKHLVNSLLKT